MMAEVAMVMVEVAIAMAEVTRSKVEAATATRHFGLKFCFKIFDNYVKIDSTSYFEFMASILASKRGSVAVMGSRAWGGNRVRGNNGACQFSLKILDEGQAEFPKTTWCKVLTKFNIKFTYL